MTQTVWDVGGDVRRALRSIVADPQLGTAVLTDPHVMANLLKDLLPDLPRESALLVAAAQCDLACVLSRGWRPGYPRSRPVTATASR